MTDTITAYKAFNADWTCRGFKYEVGKAYTHDGDVDLCRSGFHACTYPLDVFGYYPPSGSRFALVEVTGKAGESGEDSKIVSASIAIKAELRLSDLIAAAVKSVFDAATWTKKSSATGYGYRGAASATGDRGAASATGYGGAAMSSGYGGQVMGADGNALFLAERDNDNRIVAVWAGIAGCGGIKAGVWYKLRCGEPVEVEQ